MEHGRGDAGTHLGLGDGRACSLKFWEWGQVQKVLEGEWYPQAVEPQQLQHMRTLEANFDCSVRGIRVEGL